MSVQKIKLIPRCLFCINLSRHSVETKIREWEKVMKKFPAVRFSSESY